MNEQLIYNFFDDDDFLRISDRIKEAEKSTAGEIRVSIRSERKFTEKQKTINELAENEFFRLGMDRTKDKTGILIFFLLKERQFFILADKGISDKVDQQTWNLIKEEMQKKFTRGEFLNGILYGIEEVGKYLTNYFPIKPNDKDELSNRIVIS